MSVYRMTVRFNLEDDEECGAAENLQSLKHGDCNRYVVNAVLTRVRAENTNAVDPTLLDSIRRIGIDSPDSIHAIYIVEGLFLGISFYIGLNISAALKQRLVRCKNS